MEIEAKFAVPDDETFARLRAAEELGGFALSAGVEIDVRDLYLDTADDRVAAAGYTLRRRDGADAVTVTLKQATAAAATASTTAAATTAAATGTGKTDAVLRREELEVVLAHGWSEPEGSAGGPVDALRDESLDVAALPPGPLRSRLLGIVADEPVSPVLSLEQRRLLRNATDGGRLVAEVSLDAVTVQTAAGAHRYFEIEAELRPAATEQDLSALVVCLGEEWKLLSETRSKFERALAPVPESDAATVAACDARPDAQPAPIAVHETDVAQDVEPRPEPAVATIAEPVAAHDAGADAEPAAAAAAAAATSGPVSGPASGPAAAPERKRKYPGISVDDPMAEAARKTVLFHFERMLAHEDGTRAGDDYEELHDMRVATRRMRAALTVFAPYIDGAAYRPHFKELKRTGRLLGAVRDLDVFHEKAEHYLEELPEERRGELAPLFDAWRVEREHRRREMLQWLDSRGYREFVDSFADFLDRPGAGAPADFGPDGAPCARGVRIALPPVVLLELGNVLAFDEWVTGPDVPLARLHRLRIAGKYLRYTLEFFSEVLGPGDKLVVHSVKSLQDHLGDLQDAVVTSAILRDFLSGQGWGRKAGKRARELGTDLIVAPGVANYLAYKQNELERLVRTFPEAWEPIRSSRYRHTIASLLGKL